MLDKLLSPFVGYWYWAQDRATPLTKGLALGAPLVVFGLVLYLLFGRGSDSSLVPDATSTQDNIAASTQTPDAQASIQAGSTGTGATGVQGSTGVEGATGSTGTNPATTTTPAASVTQGPAPTAFAQQRYTVVSGDTPGGIAEKVGVPADIRTAWIEEMLALNGVTATGLQVGQDLILPPF